MQTMLGLTLVLLTAVGFPADAQVTLTYDYTNPALDLRCSMKDVQNTAVTIPFMLSLFRSENNTDMAMALLSLTPGVSPVIDDVRGAQVTSSIDVSGTSGSYINLHWPVANSSLEGDYKCSLSGLDDHHQLIDVDVTEQVLLTGSSGIQPVLSASPEEIRVGLTRVFSVRCSFADFAAHNVSQIASMDLFYMEGDVYDLLASITLFSPAQTNLPGQNDVVVSGSVNGSDPYLEISWEHPTHSHAGHYTCDMLALDLTYTPVHFGLTVNVTAVDSTRDELVARVLNLEMGLSNVQADLSNVQADLSHLNSSCQNTSQELDETRQQLVNTSIELSKTREQLVNTSIELSKTMQQVQILTGIASCEEANFTSGRHIVLLNPDPSHTGSININRVQVICEVTSDGKIWTVFQKRFDQSVNFNRTYAEYENGFGSLQGEFWLGLKNIIHLMGNRPCELRVDMVLNNRNYTRIYPTFGLDPPDYKLTVRGYDDGRKGLSYHNGHPFSTYDRSSNRCAAKYGGGWWYDNCSYVNLNGKPSVTYGYYWWELEDSGTTLDQSEMKLRLK